VDAQSDEMQMIRDAASRIVREAIANGIPPGRDMEEATWNAAVDSGWTALTLSEHDGGLGCGPRELCTLAEELGIGLQVGSFILGDVLSAALLAAAPAGSHRAALLELILNGSRSVASADQEPSDRGLPGAVSLRARGTADGWVLNGEKRNVWARGSTAELLVTARTEGPGAELLLCHVPLSAALPTRRFATVDGGLAFDCQFVATAVGTEAVLIGPGAGFPAARLRAWDLAFLAVAAESLGMMKALIRRTADYLGARQQFGQPLAKFQVLRHRLADMALASFRSAALIVHTARHFDELAEIERSQLVAATLVKALVGVRLVAEQAVQLHGGMGVSEEMPIGRYLKRVLALEASLGSADFHRGRFEEARSRLDQSPGSIIGTAQA
jgi:alkylation response protein AidB-like acyl-CoA dehydrogenase